MSSEKIRNIAFAAHGGAGKTSLSEVMLYKAGIIDRIGRVEDGNTVMDFEPEEIQRTTSINPGFYQFAWNKHNISIIDTPGDQNFFSSTKLCMQAADSAIFVVDAVSGVEVRTEQASDFAEEFNLPSVIFINKLDRERSDFDRAFDDIASELEPKPIKIQIPIGKEADFKGLVDLISQKAYIYNDGNVSIEDVPADIADTVISEREALIENVVEADDELLEKYLEGESISDDEIYTALQKGILTRSFMPVLCGSATQNIGIDALLDFIVKCLPSPIDRGNVTAVDSQGEEVICSPDPDAPFAGFVFKTISDPYSGRLSVFKIVSGKLGSEGNFYNTNKDVKERFTQLLYIAGKKQISIKEAFPGSIVAVAKLKETKTGDTLCDDSLKVKFQCSEPMPPVISYSVSAKSKGDEDKLFTAFSKLLEEDTSLQLTRNSETKELLVSGMGSIHVEAAVGKLKRKYNVEVELKIPKVPYKETIKKKVRVQGRHKKQSGGHGQFGDCWIQMEPLPKGQGFEFVDKIVGGSIPKTYIPAVEKGVLEASEKGVLTGFPCIDFKVILDDGSYHSVDSSEMAFKIAGSLAFKKAAEEAQPILLEPIMEVEVIAPEQFMGDLMGDLSSRRGRVLGMDSKGKNQIIKATVPTAEFLTYASDLRSMTGGRGTFTTKFSHYDEVPAEMTSKLVEELKKAQEKE